MKKFLIALVTPILSGCGLAEALFMPPPQSTTVSTTTVEPIAPAPVVARTTQKVTYSTDIDNPLPVRRAAALEK